MKKFIVFLMALLMVVSLAGCKSDAPEAVVVEADAVIGAETAETVGHRIVSLKYEGTAPATEGKDADGAEVTEGAKAVNGAVEGIGSTEYTTYGGNGGDTVQLTEPTSDSGSSKPSEGYGYEVIVDETEPTVLATEPTKPTGEEPVPTEPTKPSEPVNPVKPTEPSADYSEPVDPSEGETPTEPTQPSDPCPDHDGEEESTECCHGWAHYEAVYHTDSWIVCQCGWVCHGYDLAEGGRYAGMSPGEAWKAHLSGYSTREQLLDHTGYANEHKTTLIESEKWVCVRCGITVYENPNP